MSTFDCLPPSSQIPTENSSKVFTDLSGTQISIFVDAAEIPNSPKLLRIIRVSILYFSIYKLTILPPTERCSEYRSLPLRGSSHSCQFRNKQRSSVYQGLVRRRWKNRP
jgi:hypothetical protein